MQTSKPMRKININYKIFFILALIAFFNSNLFSQNFKQSKKIEKSFAVSKLITLEITNKYGNIEIIPYEKDTVKITVNFYIEAKEEKKFNSLKNSIDFDFKKTEYFLTAETRFQSDRNFFGDFLKFTENVVSTDSRVKVNYTILVPAYLAIKINNKFGDVTVSDVKSSFNLVLSNGNFKAKDISGNTDIDLSFCNNVEINSLNIAKLKLSYSEVEIKKAEQLTLNTKATKLRLGAVDILNIQSKRDKYYIDRVNNLLGSTYFSIVSVKEMIDVTNLDTKYGEIHIESVSKTFSLLNVKSKYTDVTINTNKVGDFQLNMEEKNSEVDIPKNFIKIKESTNNDFKTITGKVVQAPNYSTSTTKPVEALSGDKIERKIIINSEGGKNKIISK